MTRRARFTCAAGGLAVLAVIAYDVHVHGFNVVARPIVRAEFITIATAVTAIVVSLFRGLFGGVSGATKTSLLALRDGMSSLGNKLIDVAATAGGWFRSIFDTTKKMWSKYLKPFLLKIGDWIRALQRTLGSWFAPLIRWIKRIRADVLKFYRKILRPILDTIDVVRKTLRLLSLFGWDGAKKVEQKLAQLQNSLEEPFLQVVRKLNDALDWINRIVTLDGVFQRVTLLRSLVQYKRDVASFIVKAGYREVTQETYQKYRSPVLVPTPRQHGEQLLETVEFGTGKLAPAAREQGQDLIRMLRR